jgi:hypothetical protein
VSFACDHDSTRSSLHVFLATTDRHVFDGIESERGFPVLLGNCRGCHSTLAVEVDLARGHVVSGEIAKEEPWSESGTREEGSPTRGPESSGPAGAESSIPTKRPTRD